MQPDGELPDGLEPTDQMTGDARIDQFLDALAKGHLGLAAYALKPRPRRVDDRDSSTSVWTVSGGQPESSRRKH